MKILSLILITFITVTNLALGQNKLASAIENFANDPVMKSASISFEVTDLSTNEVIASLNEHLTLPTASSAKLFSTATALELLGPDYRPQTRVYLDGEIDTNGILNGNIWIRGGGDSSLGSAYFHSEKNQSQFLKDWALQIKSLGISHINGRLIADASEFGYKGAPDGWNWVDLGNYYGAGPCGLSIFDNMLKINFRTSSLTDKQSEIVSMFPNVPGMEFHNYVLSSRKSGDNAFIYGAPYSQDRFATGTLPINSSSFLVKGSLPDPAYQLAHELTKALSEISIDVTRGATTVRISNLSSDTLKYAPMELLLTHKGEALIDVINLTNMRSVNLFAEHMINLLGYEKTGDGSTDSGLEVLQNYWKKHFNVLGMHVNDGSGLSRTNAISAKNFIDLLSYMDKSKYASQFQESLPIAGVSGTLRSVCKGQHAQNRMVAKSGSMTRIKSYAGYINSSSGKRFAFALIVNNYTCSSSYLKSKMESLFNAIASY